MSIKHRFAETSAKTLTDAERQFILGEIYYTAQQAGLDPTKESSYGYVMYTKSGNACSPSLVFKLLQKLGYEGTAPSFSKEGGEVKLQRGFVNLTLTWFATFDGDRNAPQVNVRN